MKLPFRDWEMGTRFCLVLWKLGMEETSLPWDARSRPTPLSSARRCPGSAPLLAPLDLLPPCHSSSIPPHHEQLSLVLSQAKKGTQRPVG